MPASQNHQDYSSLQDHPAHQATVTSNQVAVNPSDLFKLHEQSKKTGQCLVDLLAQALELKPREAAAWLAAQFHMSFWESFELNQQLARFDLWPMTKAYAHTALVVQQAHSIELMCVIANPFDADVLAQMACVTAVSLIYVIATTEDIHAYLTHQESSIRAVDSLIKVQSDKSHVVSEIEVLSLSSATNSTIPAVQLVNSTLYDALRDGASDVHLETLSSGLCVRFRIDGVLEAITQIHDRSQAEQTISRLKVLADLDISERRVPQDGSFQVRVQDRVIDLRVSIMPSIHGEDAVIRILDKQAMIESHGKLSLEALGFEANALKILRKLAQSAYGMLLVTGPTGSGKTTTLYAALAETYNGKEKIITIEDPVEYQLPGILQIPVNEKKGLTFARGLRSILRHDPDKIMVGEIRDRETAEIAVQSALTGHLVLTTVHANNVFDVFGRFTHMGLDSYTFVSSLNGIWAQRLVRLNCVHCKLPYTPALHELKNMGLVEDDYLGVVFKRGGGCGDCRASGFKGRRAIAEFLLLDDELREMIVQRLPMRQIKEVAILKGTRSLLESALEMVREGVTTLEEVRRVTLSN
jgi:general secretion pathway protein E